MRISDWSSDVCSSDLRGEGPPFLGVEQPRGCRPNRGSIVIAEEITTPQKHVQVGNVSIGNDLPLVLIAGPCQIESLDHALMMADKIATACARSEEHTSELQSLMRNSYAVFCLQQKKNTDKHTTTTHI